MFRRMPALLLAAALSTSAVGAVLPATPAAAAKHSFNDKFTFTDVTVTDADGSTVQVTIEAGSKLTGGGSEFTTCGYYTPDYTSYLGATQSSTFASDDPAAVEDFCVQGFADRA